MEDEFTWMSPMNLINAFNISKNLCRNGIDNLRNPSDDQLNQGPLLLTWINFNPSMDK